MYVFLMTSSSVFLFCWSFLLFSNVLRGLLAPYSLPFPLVADLHYNQMIEQAEKRIGMKRLYRRFAVCFLFCRQQSRR